VNLEHDGNCAPGCDCGRYGPDKVVAVIDRNGGLGMFDVVAKVKGIDAERRFLIEKQPGWDLSDEIIKSRVAAVLCARFKAVEIVSINDAGSLKEIPRRDLPKLGLRSRA
jgi:hypothetical protein